MRIPARKLRKSTVKNIVRFPAIKSNGGKSILVESILESKFCLLLEFSPEVTEYFPQPKTFQVPFLDTDEVSTYTPDFEVLLQNGQRTYVEVKPSKFAERDEFSELFSRFKVMLEGSDINFIVVSEEEILREPRKTNFEKLYRYKKVKIDPSVFYEIASKSPIPLSISFLLKKYPEKLSIKDVYAGIAKGYLQFEFDEDFLDINTEVTFNV